MTTAKEIENTDGSMLGIIDIEDSKKDLCGVTVEAVLRPKNKREGNLKDILYFKEI